jgi:hypothetical protein
MTTAVPETRANRWLDTECEQLLVAGERDWTAAATTDWPRPTLSSHDRELGRIRCTYQWSGASTQAFAVQLLILRHVPRPQFPVADQSAEAGISSARWILSLAEDWDDNGAPAIQEDTLSRMELVVRDAVRCAVDSGLTLPEPAISPIPDGSIDVQWRWESHLLAVNVPSMPEKRPSFYATTNDGIHFGGSWDSSVALPVLAWLMA